MLREAFEKNAWLVDLSLDHVPDINVITSEFHSSLSPYTPAPCVHLSLSHLLSALAPILSLAILAAAPATRAGYTYTNSLPSTERAPFSLPCLVLSLVSSRR